MIEQINPTPIASQNITITIGNTDCNLLLAEQIMYNCIQAQCSEKKPLELKSFSNDIVENLGTTKTPVKFNDCQIPKARLRVVADGFLPILGRDSFVLE